jgi:hypothetical protein
MYVYALFDLIEDHFDCKLGGWRICIIWANFRTAFYHPINSQWTLMGVIHYAYHIFVQTHMSFIICMLTLLLMPLAGLHFCVWLDLWHPSLWPFLSKHQHHYHIMHITSPYRCTCLQIICKYDFYDSMKYRSLSDGKSLGSSCDVQHLWGCDAALWRAFRNRLFLIENSKVI